MKFCTNCSNMYYIKLEGETSDQLIYYCRNCGQTNDDLMDTGKCILKENITKNDNKYNVSINKYTKKDNTLPRVSYIKCPNGNCHSNADGFDVATREVIYVRYDQEDMKYLYLCSHCDHTWNPEK